MVSYRFLKRDQHDKTLKAMERAEGTSRIRGLFKGSWLLQTGLGG